MHPAYLYALAIEREHRMNDVANGRPVRRAPRRRWTRRRP